MMDGTKKILKLDSSVGITATCVRVPVLNSHSVEINVEFEKNPSVEELRAVLEDARGIIVYDKVEDNIYPMPILSNGRDEIFVGRIRKDVSRENSFHIFCVGDNIRKGAASNAIQIVEMLENR